MEANLIGVSTCLFCDGDRDISINFAATERHLREIALTHSVSDGTGDVREGQGHQIFDIDSECFDIPCEHVVNATILAYLSDVSRQIRLGRIVMRSRTAHPRVVGFDPSGDLCSDLRSELAHRRPSRSFSEGIVALDTFAVAWPVRSDGIETAGALIVR